MDFRHLIVTCLFSMLRLSFETQKIKKNYAILILLKTGSFARKVREFYPESPGLLRGKLRSFEQPLPFSIKFPLYL